MNYILAIIFWCFANSSQATEYKLFEDTIKNNAAIQAAYQEYLAINAESFVTLADYLPQAELNYKDYENEVGKSSGSIPTDYDIDETNINVSQKIFEFGAIRKLSSARLKKRQYKIALLELISSKYVSLIELSLLIDSEQKRLSYLEKNLKLLEEIQKIAKIRFKSGAVNKLDNLQAQTEYMRAKSEYLTVQKDLLANKANYKRISGVSYSDNNLKKPEEVILPLNEFQELATVNNFTLKRTKLDNKIAKNTHYMEHKQFAPEAEFFYDYNKTDGNYSYLTNSTSSNSSTTYGVSVTVPLFKSGANIASVAKAKRNYLMSSFNYQDEVAAVRSEAVDIWENINLANQIVETQSKYLEYSEQSLKAANSNYKYGKTDLLNLLEAQKLHVEAKYELTKAENNVKLYYYKYLHLIGKLSPEYFQIDLDSILIRL